MPKNLHFDIRKKTLNELFRSKKGYTLEELKDKVGETISDFRANSKGVSKKTIQNDIRYMREEAAKMNAAIVCEASRYRYEPPDFNIYDIQIEPFAIEKIKLAAALLKQIPGLDIHDELREVFEKLDMRAEYDEQDINYIQFDTRPGYTGAEYLAELLECIKGENVISFDYQPFISDQSHQVILHPYLLKEYNNRWFLIGLPEHLRQQGVYEYYVYGLERIKSKIKVEKIKYYRHSQFDPATYYQHVIGVTIPQGAKPEKIVLRFAMPRAKYVETNPLHLSQRRVVGKEDTFEFQLIKNNELVSCILSFGRDVEVLESMSLRKEIISILTHANNIYYN